MPVTLHLEYSLGQFPKLVSGPVKHTTDTCNRRTVLYTVRGIRAINYLCRDLYMHLYPKHENKGPLMEGDRSRCLVTGVPVEYTVM